MADRNRVDTRIRLSAEGVQEVVRAFQQVERQGQRSGSSLTSTFQSLGRLLPAISFAAVTAGLVAVSKRTIDAADNLSKLSQRTGVAVETLSVLQHAANLSDVSIESLGTAFARMSRAAFEASQGSKEQARSFAQLGVTLKGRRKTPMQVEGTASKHAHRGPRGDREFYRANRKAAKRHISSGRQQGVDQREAAE